MDKFVAIRPGALRSAAKVLSVYAVLASASPAMAEALSELQIDNVYKITAEKVVLDNGLVHMSLPLAGSRPVTVPAERVRCLTNCPPDLIKLAQLMAATALPANAQGFQIHGSNTIGAELMPDLVEAYLTLRQAKVDREGVDNSDPKIPRVELNFETEQGAAGKIEIFSGGSGTGFEKLRDKAAQIWMSSRPAKKEEIKQYGDLKLGSLTDPQSEHVIALDGLAVIVNTANPVGVLSLDDIAKIYAGKITDWSEVGGPSGKITAFRRSNESGTNSTFMDLVMSPAKLPYADGVETIVESEELQTKIQRDPKAIGFIGIGFVSEGVKTLAISTSCGMAFKPNKFSIKTEEYPLSRRLFLYTPGQSGNEVAGGLLNFVLSSQGQRIVSQRGFVELGLDVAEKFEAQAGRIANMLAAGPSDPESTKRFINTVRFAERLPLTVRFKSNSTEIDNKGQRDLDTLADILSSNEGYQKRELLLIGFSDEQDSQKALEVSQERALIVANALKNRLDSQKGKGKELKIFQENVKWFGAAGPIACNTDDHGRALNRRVEVWMR